MEKKLLIVAIGNDLEFLNIILNIVHENKDDFCEIVILDTHNIIKNYDTFARKFLWLASLKSPDEIIFKNIKNIQRWI